MGLLPKSLRTQEMRDKSKDLGGDFSAIPAGDYYVSLITAKIRQTNSGKDRLNFELEVVSDIDGDTEFAGRRVFYASNIDEQGAPYLIAAFDAFDLGDDPDLDDIEDAKGTEATCTVIVREWEGKEQNDVRNLAPIGTKTKADPNDADDDPDWDPDEDDD